MPVPALVSSRVARGRTDGAEGEERGTGRRTAQSGAREL